MNHSIPKVLAVVEAHHPVVPLFNSNPEVFDSIRQLAIESFPGTVGCDVLRIGYESEGQKPITLIIKVKPDMVSWEQGSRLAHDMERLLRRFNISDVRCEVYEAPFCPYGGGSSATAREVPETLSTGSQEARDAVADEFATLEVSDSSSTALQTVGVSVDVRSTCKEAVEAQAVEDVANTGLFLSTEGLWDLRCRFAAVFRNDVFQFTPYLSPSIGAMSNPGISGSSGLHAHLLQNCGYNGIRRIPIMITARHVVCSKGDTRVVSQLGISESPSEPIRVVQPSQGRLDSILPELAKALDDLDQNIHHLEEWVDPAERNEHQAEILSDTALSRERCKTFLEHCESHIQPASRNVGNVIASPAIGVFRNTMRDWAVVQFHSSILTPLHARNLVNVTNIPRVQLACATDQDGVMEIKTYFTREAIVERDPSLPNRLTSDDAGIPKRGNIEAYMVGGSSGGSWGTINSMMSYNWESSSTIEFYAVIAGKKVHTFSDKGDSGSVVFSVLPARLASSTFPLSPSRRGAQSMERPVPGVIGMLWGGHNYDYHSRIEYDISFVIPFESIKEDIEEFTGCRLEFGTESQEV
ncbi:uncharacterized protein F4822DRAFT_305361 [Hypoxylon trugodes]|uniref:uncharacterized protein n=1 Tax=Hypoxylon trugodes TaxID=326681 RepID=UPI0021A20F8B|nr:uncharacterized protein F4822DRAFT_305361 [Hypoxylon trugodes]KAI1386097.1 hypothetical protein F4822DRAFT_305361 [Hypoxylon trugodes]